MSLDAYRALARHLSTLPADAPEREIVLHEMDRLWYALTPEERVGLDAEP